MELFVIIILGIVQGLTEFLPVSSSGHLVLLENIFGVSENKVFLNVVLHFATLIAVVIFYRKKLWNIVKHPFQPITAHLAIATAITCAIVLIFPDFFESTFNGRFLSWGFILSAIFLFSTEWISRKYEKEKYPYTKIGDRQAILLGVFQGLAILPGVSRSGTTLCAGIVMGVEKKDALDFSFLMSVPIILASVIYELVKCKFQLLITDINAIELGIGGITAFICAILGIKLMLKIVEKVQYKWFAIYLLILAYITFIVI